MLTVKKVSVWKTWLCALIKFTKIAVITVLTSFYWACKSIKARFDTSNKLYNQQRYFVDLTFFLVGISWVQNFLSWVFRRSKTFFRRYFVSPFFFVVNYLIQRFSVAGWMRNTSQIAFSISDRFQQPSVLFILER